MIAEGAGHYRQPRIVERLARVLSTIPMNAAVRSWLKRRYIATLTAQSGGKGLLASLPGGEIVSAMDRGLLDGAEFNNASSDRVLGFPDVSKVCMLQSFHQSSEQFEISFNKTKYEALPPKMKAIIANAVEASSADMSWKAIDRYSKDYREMQTKDRVKFYKTPDALLQTQLTVWDEVVAKKGADNALFREVEASQRAFAERAMRWDMDTNNNRRMAFNHYFGPKKAAKS